MGQDRKKLIESSSGKAPEDPYSGMPKLGPYQGAYDPSSMSMEKYIGSHYDDAGMKAFSQEALRKGPSAWSQLARESNRANEENSRERGAREVAGQTAQATDALAARGGLSSGARERAGMEGAKNYMSMSQDTAHAADANDMQIGMNDEQNRIQQLGMLPGMEMQKTNMFSQGRGQDITNAVAETGRKNLWNMEDYKQQMGAWGAAKQANAMESIAENSGKKG